MSILSKVHEVAEKIRRIEIQGATKVAKAAILAIKEFAENADEKTFREEFYNVTNELMNTRPTEPAMHNGIRYIIYTYEKFKEEDDVRLRVVEAAGKYLKILEESFKKIVDVGWKRVPDEGIVMTHCHSNTVTAILVKAFEEGKKFKVISSETRPLYQGRKTTEELAEAGIKVYHIVDSAMRWAARKFKPDIAIIGSDAISSTGVVINKIGSKLLALVAKEFDFPLYVASTLLKLDISSLLGDYIHIEMRSPNEIWPNIPEEIKKNVEILNPAFETVAPEFIDGIISEAGIIRPEIALLTFKETYPEIWSVVSKKLHSL